MSLIIYLSKEDIPNNEEFVHDVEKEFLNHTIPVNDTTKRILQEIEEITLETSGVLLDRFGYKLRSRNICTGSKAAICVMSTNKIISLIECGNNARDVIVKYVREGKIYLPRFSVTVAGDNEAIDVIIGKYKFNTIKRLNYYLHYEYDITKPDMRLEGISCV